MKRSTKTILVIIVSALIIGPLYAVPSGESGRSNDVVEGQAIEGNPDYEPWPGPLTKSKPGGVESLLFASQAALGVIIIGCYLGYNKGKKNALS